MLLLQVKVVCPSASDTRLPNPTNSLGYILAPGKGSVNLILAPDHDLPRSLAEGFPAELIISDLISARVLYKLDILLYLCYILYKETYQA